MLTRRQRPRGQALVEFSAVLLLLLLLLAGIVDVVRAVTAYTHLDNAAQEGALYGALRPTDTAGLETRVRETLSSMFANPNDVQVAVTYDTQPCPGHFVQVEVTGRVVLIFPFAELFAADRNLTLRATAQQMILSNGAPGCP